MVDIVVSLLEGDAIITMYLNISFSRLEIVSLITFFYEYRMIPEQENKVIIAIKFYMLYFNTELNATHPPVIEQRVFLLKSR